MWKMDNKEAIKYLIPPIATSTESSAEYLKQKEAYDLAIKALEKRPQGEWKETDFPESALCECSVCGFDLGAYSFNFCPNCGADMRNGSEGQ